jgi:hypothetical protein
LFKYRQSVNKNGGKRPSERILLRKNFEGQFFVWYASILLIVINFDGSAARFARRR